ncbi:MAG: hypothetical protein KJ025_10235 [Burkholderiales bacterium]|nr:hypothetical protein [Burkholderiales bacterium]
MRFPLIRNRFSGHGRRRLKAALAAGLGVIAVAAAAFGAYAYIAYHDKLAKGTGGLGPVTVPLGTADYIQR